MLGGIRWNYFVLGKGTPLFIAPPFHADIDRLRPLVEALAPYFRVIVPELPGVASPNPLPHNYGHTARSYAVFLVKLVKKLNLGSYVLFGISLGGIIAIRMLELGIPPPKHLVVFGAPIHGEYIHLPPDGRLGYFFYRLVRRNRDTAIWFTRAIMQNPVILPVVFGIRFFGYKGYTRIIAHQIRLTRMMHPRAWVEVIEDVFSMRLPEEGLRFWVPTMLIYNKYDNVVDVKKTIHELKKIFPRSQTYFLNDKLHAPVGPMAKDELTPRIRPILSFLNISA